MKSKNGTGKVSNNLLGLGIVSLMVVVVIVVSNYVGSIASGDSGGSLTSSLNRIKSNFSSDLQKEKHRHFHNIPDDAEKQLSPNPSFCLSCHGLYPHNANKVVRAMFNFHKRFIACETCHLKGRYDREQIGYRWYDGTSRNLGDLLEAEGYEDVNALDEAGVMQKDLFQKYGFKISPYKMQGDKLIMMVLRAEDPFAEEVKALAGKFTSDQQARIKGKIHGKVDPAGTDCIMCHNKDPLVRLLPFESLGFTDERVKDLIQTEAAGLFKYYSRDPKFKGQTFVIPSMKALGW